MNTPIRPRILLLAAAAAAVVVAAGTAGRAGSLAPADTVVDTAGQIGPFWGSDTGLLLYARGSGGGQELMRRGIGEFSETLYEAGDGISQSEEIWAAFHGGAINDRGDAAFVASTTLEDDPVTPEDETLLPARRAAWALRGNTLFQVGRYGGPSPIALPFGEFVPWGTFFDAAPFGRPDAGPISVAFSAQLGAPDGRQGVFRWDETTGTVTPIALAGDPAPTGGTFTTFGRVRVNEGGDFGFYGLTQTSSTAPVIGGIFVLDRNGQFSRLVKFGTEGEDAPGGGILSLMQDFDLDGEGGAVFAASVQGGSGGSALFRRLAGAATPEVLVRQGDTTPLGGKYETFTQSQVRCGEDGTTTFLVPLSDDIGGAGLFAIGPGSTFVEPLGASPAPLTLASLGAGRVAYQTEGETHTIVPADGSVEGPPGFRIALVDVRNAVPLKKDVIQVDARFLLPPWGTGAGQAPPAVFSSAAERSSPTATLAPSALAKIVEVRVQVSQAPGQTFVFGVGGTDAAPRGTVTVNGTTGSVSSLTISKTKDAATWKFVVGIGRGTCAADLAKGTLRLTLTKASILPSFEAEAFRVEMTLRTDGDVGAGRSGDLAYFHRSVRLDALQAPFGSGRRVLSKGERLPGGTLYVDALRVDRKQKVVKGQPAPQVTSDKVTMTGTLRLAPGATPPSTPTLGATVSIGSLSIPSIPLQRIGRKGSKYAAKVAIPGGTSGPAGSATLTVDAIAGTFSLVALNSAPLTELANADFSGAGGPNDAKRTVGGMTLPVSIHVDRMYEAAIDVAMTRLPGGKSFTR